MEARLSALNLSDGLGPWWESLTWQPQARPYPLGSSKCPTTVSHLLGGEAGRAGTAWLGEQEPWGSLEDPKKRGTSAGEASWELVGAAEQSPLPTRCALLAGQHTAQAEGAD